MKISSQESKSDGVRIVTHSKLDIFNYTGLKGPKKEIKKKNFQPPFITSKESGEKFLKNTFDYLENYEPIHVNFHSVENFSSDLNTK